MISSVQIFAYATVKEIINPKGKKITLLANEVYWDNGDGKLLTTNDNHHITDEEYKVSVKGEIKKIKVYINALREIEAEVLFFSYKNRR